CIRLSKCACASVCTSVCTMPAVCFVVAHESSNTRLNSGTILFIVLIKGVVNFIFARRPATLAAVYIAACKSQPFDYDVLFGDDTVSLDQLVIHLLPLGIECVDFPVLFAAVLIALFVEFLPFVGLFGLHLGLFHS